MYLKRITVAGFKSFAGRVSLDLSPGIMAVVGPNGSGKSNIADAIRWALGEQSKSRLRLNDRDEVIFAGTQQRPRASLAEVILLFDNQSGAFPVEQSEVEISRRLYRSGESEYRLNGKPAVLRDVQLMMAEAGFGGGTYAVIGQGMIDSLILSSPAERKLLFDEAAGIRSAELKREASLRQLSATSANLVRLRDISGELGPRLAMLEGAMATSQAVERLRERLALVRKQYVATAQAEVAAELREHELKVGQLTRESHHWRHEALAASALRRRQQQLQVTAQSRQATLRQEQERLNEAAQHAALDVARLQAQSAQAAAALQRFEQDERNVTLREHELSEALSALEETNEELARNTEAVQRAQVAVSTAQKEVGVAQAELMELRDALNDDRQQRYVGHALELIKAMAAGLNDNSMDPAELRLLVHKAGRLLSHATRSGEAALLVKLKQAQTHLEAAMSKREVAAEHQTNITISRRSLELDAAHQKAVYEQLAATLTQLKQTLASSAQAVQEAQGLAEALEQAQGAAESSRNTYEQFVRQAVNGERGGNLDGTAIADAVSRHERSRVRLAALRDDLHALGIRKIQLHAHLQAIQTSAQTWNTAVDSKFVVHTQSNDLQRSVERLELELAARQDHVQATSKEYAEVQDRVGQLAAQIVDLESAEENLRALIQELDRQIRERFKSNFAALSHEFSQSFSTLFSGGAAALALEEGEDGEYGIIIQASPKGKRPGSLTALSGGERAMAGVALLAAILAVNPSPFVVLDEIDAALDEANSGRLAIILHQLQLRSQLIVITHNRQTMQSARALFGVTVDAQHVSRLVTMHLEEATEQAAR